jgi:ABC-type phosphate/phosphonate transport system substrate-binding protein
LVGMPSLDFLQIKDKIPLEPALSYSLNNQVGTEYVLIVPKDKESHSLSGLKNKKIIIHKHDDTGLIPILWLNSLLRQQGLPPAERFCGSIKKVDQVSQAVLPVYFRQADCCVVTCDGFETMKELNPQLG